MTGAVALGAVALTLIVVAPMTGVVTPMNRAVRLGVPPAKNLGQVFNDCQTPLFVLQRLLMLMLLLFDAIECEVHEFGRWLERLNGRSPEWQNGHWPVRSTNLARATPGVQLAAGQLAADVRELRPHRIIF